MTTNQVQKNREHQQAWYLRQKVLHGQVYLITFPDGKRYVGSTRNGLMKRKWHHNNMANSGKDSQLYQHMRLFGNNYSIETVYTCKHGDDLLGKEQEYINQLEPELNHSDAVRQPWKYRKYCCKDGVEFAGFFWPTRFVLWQTLGKTKYNTFKTRLHRGYSYRQALGMEPL